MGLGFQIPIGILAAVKLRITSVEKLRRNRRYAVLVIAVLAALLPTIDPVSMLLEMVPLLLLYELSIIMAKLFVKPAGEMTDPVAPAEGS
jgi:sec-independent protein translocase protein TatC